MGYKSNDHQDNVKAATYNPHLGSDPPSDDEITPAYYDSEPSSQPPKYMNTQAAWFPNPPPANKSISKPVIAHRNSAPANMVAAILASPYDDLDAQRRAERKSKTLRERWRAFRERNFGEEYDAGKDRVGHSAAEFNVMGAKPSSGLPSPYRRKSKK